MNDENGGNGRRRRNRNAAIGGVTQTEQEIQEQINQKRSRFFFRSFSVRVDVAESNVLPR